MKFTVEREHLLKPLQQVSGPLGGRPTLPILGNLLLQVTDGALSLTGTDLEMEMVARVALIQPHEAGATTVPARKFFDICRGLPEGAEIAVQLEGERMLVRSGRSRFSLSTLPAADFPNLDDWQSDSIVPLIADAVKRIPLMAAGGITDHRTARAAHALGAEGIFAGSVFIATEESRVPASVKNRIIAANGLDLRLFRTLPHYYRSLPGRLAEKLVSMDKAGASREALGEAMGGLRGLRIGMLEGNADEGYISLGTGIGNIRSVKSVAEVVDALTVD